MKQKKYSNTQSSLPSPTTAQLFNGILFHDAADGTEKLEALPFEAKPTSSKRALKRSSDSDEK